jgi:hypothetical protein
MNDPWTNPDLNPATSMPNSTRRIEMHDGNPDAKLSILVSVGGDDAKRLERIASERGQQPGEVVSELLRNIS